jgi:hypothetical protein
MGFYCLPYSVTWKGLLACSLEPGVYYAMKNLASVGEMGFYYLPGSVIWMANGSWPQAQRSMRAF